LNQQSAGPHFKLRPFYGIVCITVLALLVRIGTATWTGLTADEANGVMLAITGSWSEVMQRLAGDGNAPLFYALMRMSNYVIGHQGFTLKCMACLFSAAIVPLTYALLRRVLERDICLALALLLALCPTVVSFDSLIRPYALTQFFGLLSTYACMRVLTPSTNIWRLIAYGVSTALVVYTHYIGAFVPIGHLGMVLIGTFKGWFGRRQLLYWFGGAALAFLLFLPQLHSVFSTVVAVSNDLSTFDLAPRPFALASDFLPQLLVGSCQFKDFRNDAFPFICHLIIFFTFLSPRLTLVERVTKEGEEVVFDSRMWKAATVCGLTAALFVDFCWPALRWRYLMPFAPMAFIVSLTGGNAMFVGKSWLIRLALPCAIWIAMFLPFLLSMPSTPDTTADNLVAEIAKNADRKKDAVFIMWEIVAPTINFSLPADIESYSYPHLVRTSINYWPDMAQRVRDRNNLVLTLEKMQTVLDRGGRVWLLDLSHPVHPLDYRDDAAIGNVPFVEMTVRRSNQIWGWLITHAHQVGPTKVAPGQDMEIILSQFVPISAADKAKNPLPSPDSLWKKDTN